MYPVGVRWLRFKRYINNVWRLWCKALGTKEGNCDKEANIVATFRTLMVLFNLIVGIFIMANAIVHWPAKTGGEDLYNIKVLDYDFHNIREGCGAGSTSLRELIIYRLEGIGHKQVKLLEEEGRYWGVCFQIDKYLEGIIGDSCYYMEEWIQESTYYREWVNRLGGKYVPFHKKHSFSYEDRYTLCLGLAAELKGCKDSVFGEYTPTFLADGVVRLYDSIELNLKDYPYRGF